jgi:hypothetical protein
MEVYIIHLLFHAECAGIGAFEPGDDVGAASAVFQADIISLLIRPIPAVLADRRYAFPVFAFACCLACSSFSRQLCEHTLSARLMNHLPQTMQRCGAF